MLGCPGERCSLLWLGYSYTVLLLIGSCSAAVLLHSQHYAALGLQPGAAAADVKRAYRQLALKLHPDKNPSPGAADRWLRVQQAYEALTDKSGEHSGSSSGYSNAGFGGRSAHHQHPHQSSSRFWRTHQHQRWQPPHIQSVTEDLDAAAFHRQVLAGGRDAAGGAWLLQIYADASPYCRVLSFHWEQAAREMGEALTLARIDASSHPMLVRFVASHLRLFRSLHPDLNDMPTVFGMPAGCTSMSCAVVYAGHFTAKGLQHFAATQLLRLAPLPPLSRRLLGAWLQRARVEGKVAVLALLPEKQQPPMALLSAVGRAQGRIQAAYSVWRPAHAALWTAATGATGAPALVVWPSHSELPVVVQGHNIKYAAEIERHSRQLLPPLHAGTACDLPACWPGGSSGGVDPVVSGATPSSGFCVMLLGRKGQQHLTDARRKLEVLLEQLTTIVSSSSRWNSNSKRQASSEMQQAAKALLAGKMHTAWADARRQPALCRHLLRWSSSDVSIGCLCGSWWQRLPLAALERCSLRQAAPALVAYQQQQPSIGRSHGRIKQGQLLLAAYQGSLSDSQQLAAWLASVAATSAGSRSGQQLLHPAPQLPALQDVESSFGSLQGLLLWSLHLISGAELLWHEAQSAVGSIVGTINWQQVSLGGALAVGVLGLKRLLDVLSGEGDGDGGDGFPVPRTTAPPRTSGNAGERSSSRGRRVSQMRHADWDPSPGRYLVVLPLPADDGGGSMQQRPAAAGAALQGVALAGTAAGELFELLAAHFQREPRLVFRVAPVSDALCKLLAGVSDTAGGSGGSSLAGEGQQWEAEPFPEKQQPGEQELDQQQQGQQRKQPSVAVVLRPGRERFQALPLQDVQHAVLRLEAVLDGGGEWRRAK